MRGTVTIDIDDYNELRENLTRAECRLNMLADTVIESIDYVGNAPLIKTDAVLTLLKTFDMDVDGAIEAAQKKYMDLMELWERCKDNPMPLMADDEEGVIDDLPFV